MKPTTSIALIVAATIALAPRPSSAGAAEDSLPLARLLAAELRLDAVPPETLAALAHRLVARLAPGEGVLAIGATNDVEDWLTAVLALEHAVSRAPAAPDVTVGRDLMTAYEALWRVGLGWQRSLDLRLTLHRMAAAVAGRAEETRVRALRATLGELRDYARERLLPRLESATAAKPSDAHALTTLGELLLDAGDRAGALEAFGRAVDAEPTPLRRLARARVLWETGAVAAARRVLADVEREHPELAPLAARVRLHGERWDQRRVLERGGALATDADAGRRHARLLFASGELDRALAVYDALLARFPNDADIVTDAAGAFVAAHDIARWRLADEHGEALGLRTGRWQEVRLVGRVTHAFLAELGSALRTGGAMPSLRAALGGELEAYAALRADAAGLLEMAIDVAELAYRPGTIGGATAAAEQARELRDRIDARLKPLRRNLHAHVLAAIAELTLEPDGETALARGRKALKVVARKDRAEAGVMAGGLALLAGARGREIEHLRAVDRLQRRASATADPRGIYQSAAASWLVSRLSAGPRPADVRALEKAVDRLSPWREDTRALRHALVCLLASHALETNDLPAAGRWVRAARLLGPSHPVSDLLAGVAALRTGRLEGAHELLSAALRRDLSPELELITQLWLAEVARRAGDQDVRRQHARAARDLMEDQPALDARPAALLAVLGPLDVAIRFDLEEGLVVAPVIEPLVYVLPDPGTSRADLDELLSAG